MKVLTKLSRIVLITCLMASIFSSCTKDAQLETPSENLDLQAMFEDQDFIQLAQQYELLATQVQDVNAVQEVVQTAQERGLDPSNKNKLVASLGFKNSKNFESFNSNLAAHALSLESKYGLSKRDRSELTAAYQQYMTSMEAQDIDIQDIDIPLPFPICFFIFEICTGGAVIVDTIIFAQCMADGGELLTCLEIYANIYTVCFRNMIDCLT